MPNAELDTVTIAQRRELFKKPLKKLLCQFDEIVDDFTTDLQAANDALRQEKAMNSSVKTDYARLKIDYEKLSAEHQKLRTVNHDLADTLEDVRAELRQLKRAGAANPVRAHTPRRPNTSDDSVQHKRAMSVRLGLVGPGTGKKVTARDERESSAEVMGTPRLPRHTFTSANSTRVSSRHVPTIVKKVATGRQKGHKMAREDCVYCGKEYAIFWMPRHHEKCPEKKTFRKSGTTNNYRRSEVKDYLANNSASETDVYENDD